MHLFHVTEGRFVKSIWKTGLKPEKSRGRVPRVWLCCRELLPWAFGHVAERHGVAVPLLVALEVNVPATWLSHPRRGIWYTRMPVPAERLSGLIHIWEVARA